jgi:hypothetical protein
MEFWRAAGRGDPPRAIHISGQRAYEELSFYNSLLKKNHCPDLFLKQINKFSILITHKFSTAHISDYHQSVFVANKVSLGCCLKILNTHIPLFISHNTPLSKKRQKDTFTKWDFFTLLTIIIISDRLKKCK